MTTTSIHARRPSSGSVRSVTASERRAARRAAARALGRARAARAAHEHAGRIRARHPAALGVEGLVPAPARADVVARAPAADHQTEDGDAGQEQYRPEEVV